MTARQLGAGADGVHRSAEPSQLSVDGGDGTGGLCWELFLSEFWCPVLTSSVPTDC